MQNVQNFDVHIFSAIFAEDEVEVVPNNGLQLVNSMY